MQPIDIVTGIVKLAAALVGLISGIVKLTGQPGGALAFHKLLFLCFIVYIIADLIYYTAANAPGLPIRVTKWIIGIVVAAVSLVLNLDYKATVPPIPTNPPAGWVVATFLVVAYLVFDVTWCFIKDHYDKWWVAGAACLIGLCYAWLIL